MVILSAKCHYCTALKSALKKMHFSVTLDLVADKLKQSVHNLYYRFIFTGALMVLLCLDLAIDIIIICFIASLFKWLHIAAFFHLAHSLLLACKASGVLASFCMSHCLL